MSYYDWQHLTKPFKFEPVEQDTLVNTKALSITPVDSVATGFFTLSIPAHDFTPYSKSDIIGASCVPLIVGQYCYSTTDVITLINANKVAFKSAIPNLALCIRYRVGNAVYRYKIMQSVINAAWKPFYVDSYAGQVIKPNFVIEVWQLGPIPTAAIHVSVLDDLLVQLGNIHFPTSQEDAAPVISPSAILDLTDLQYVIPESLPTNINTSGPWLSN